MDFLNLFQLELLHWNFDSAFFYIFYNLLKWHLVEVFGLAATELVSVLPMYTISNIVTILQALTRRKAEPGSEGRTWDKTD